MEYIRLFENESEMALTNVLMGTKDGKVKMIVPVPEPAYKIKVSANGPGQIIVNQGLGVDVLTINGVTYPRIDIYDKVVDRTHYYAYGDFVSVGGVYMVTDNTVGEYEDTETYWLTFDDTYTYNRYEEDDLTIDGVNYYSFGSNFYLKTTTPGTYGANDLFIIEDGETVQTITEAWGYIYDEFIIKEDGNGVLMYYMTSNGEYTYTIEAPESIENKQQVLNYTGGEDQWLGCDTEIVNVYAVLNDYDEEMNYIGDTTLTSIEIPNSVTSIGNGAFYNCTGLTSITIPDSVTSIGTYAFYNCTGLTSVVIPNSVTSIDEYAFEYCTGLTSINIPDSVTSISEGVFGDCSGLTSINIPDSVTSIGTYAFEYCTGLTSINIPDSVTSIDDNVFDCCSGLISIEIPDSVTSIGCAAFAGCSGLTSVTIGSGVTSIGRDVFINCSGLTSINIPDSVTSIGGAAFAGCSGLTSIEIPDSVTTIGDGAFRNCSGLTSIEIPNSVTTIGQQAFSSCTGLTSVVIPNSVTTIGNQAFFYCTGLTSINYTGTMAQWKAITKGYYWHDNVPATVVHCSDGDVTL